MEHSGGAVKYFLSQLIKDYMQKRNLGLRPAAREIGISHTTLDRVLKGDIPNIPSAQKLAKWLNVPMEDILNAYKDDKAGLAAKVALAIEVEPQLEQVFTEAMSRIEEGTMTIDTFRELIRYMSFRLRESEVGTGRLN